MKKTLILSLLCALSWPVAAFAAESAVDVAAQVYQKAVGKKIGCIALVVQDCLSFLERAERNKTLSTALEYARNKGVWVSLGDRFDTGFGLVIVDVNTSDERVVKFLTGK